MPYERGGNTITHNHSNSMVEGVQIDLYNC